MSLRCLVVDDDAFTLTTVAAALEGRGFTIVGAVSDVESALACDVAEIDSAVLDLDLGDGPNGIDIAHALRRRKPAIGIVILTSFSDPRLLASSVQQPPEGSAYVVKQSLTAIGFLCEAINSSVEGAGASTFTGLSVALSDSQIETLRLLSYGLTNAEIARVRVVSEKAVEQAIRRSAVLLKVDSGPLANQRVALARAFFELTGATRHAHIHR